MGMSFWECVVRQARHTRTQSGKVVAGCEVFEEVIISHQSPSSSSSSNVTTVALMSSIMPG